MEGGMSMHPLILKHTPNIWVPPALNQYTMCSKRPKKKTPTKDYCKIKQTFFSTVLLKSRVLLKEPL